MEPARVALDIGALQDGSGADEGRRRRVSERAAALARDGRLAAALLTPELPAPAAAPEADGGGLPPELCGPGAALLRWDCRREARALVGAHPSLVHHVPAPLLHARPEDRGGLVVSSHWADAGVPRVVTLEPNDVARLTGPTTARMKARLDWIRGSDVVEIERYDAADAADAARAAEASGASRAPHAAGPARGPAAVLGLDPSRLVPAGRALEHLDRAGSWPARGRPPMDLRIAVFGPFPPGGGGIGDYNARFVTALAAVDGIAVDAVSTTGMGWEHPPGVGLVHTESFGTDIRAASYDSVIYTVGNSDGHLATVEAALRHPGWLWLHEARLPAIATTALAPLSDDAFAAHMERLLRRSYPGRPPIAAARTAGRSHLALAAAGVGLAGPLAERAAGVLVNSSAASRSLLLDLPPLSWKPPVTVLPPACPPVRPRRPPTLPEPAAQEPAAQEPAAQEPAAQEPAAPEPAAPEPADQAVAFGVVSMGKRPELLVDAAALAGCRLAFVGPCPDILRMVIGDRATARGIPDRVEVTGRLDDDGWWEWMGRATLAVQLRDSAGGEMSAAVLDALSAGVPVLTNLASAGDYPEGTVELVQDASPAAEALAAAMRRLLGPAGAGRRAALSRAAQQFAAGHQMEHLVAAVVAAIESDAAPPAALP